MEFLGGFLGFGILARFRGNHPCDPLNSASEYGTRQWHLHSLGSPKGRIALRP